MFCTIYKLVNNSNDKVYVGQTWQTMHQRFAEHKSKSKCHKLVNAFNKYGRDNFQIVLLTIAHTQEVADYWENHFIELYQSIKHGYNIQFGGSHGKHSEETKNKLRGENNGMYGKTHTPEVRKLISDRNIGHTLTIQQRQKIVSARTGQPHPHKGSPRKGIRWSKKLNKSVNTI